VEWYDDQHKRPLRGVAELPTTKGLFLHPRGCPGLVSSLNYLGKVTALDQQQPLPPPVSADYAPPVHVQGWVYHGSSADTIKIDEDLKARF